MLKHLLMLFIYDTIKHYNDHKDYILKGFFCNIILMSFSTFWSNLAKKGWNINFELIYTVKSQIMWS